MTALIFDIDDTLYDLEEPFRQAFAECYGSSYDIDVEQLFKFVRIYSDRVFEDSESGRISMDDMYAYRLQKAMGEFHIKVSRNEALHFQDAYEHFQKKISLTEDMKRCLDEISQRPVFLGCISNGKYDHQMEKVKILGLTRWFPEEHILISGACPYSKPDVRIFTYAQDMWNLRPEDTWYIGDTFYNDIVGPNEAGWHTVWYNHRKNEMPKEANEPDYTVTEEKDFINLILRISGESPVEA